MKQSGWIRTRAFAVLWMALAALTSSPALAADATTAEALPARSPGAVLAQHNKTVLEKFPTRTDLLFDLENLDSSRFRPVVPLYMAPPILSAKPESLGGHWTVVMTMMVDLNGKVYEIVLQADKGTPRELKDVCAEAAGRMVFQSPTYDGRPYFTVVQQSFVFDLDGKASLIAELPEIRAPATSDGANQWRVGPLRLDLPAGWRSDGRAKLSGPSRSFVTFLSRKPPPGVALTTDTWADDAAIDLSKFGDNANWLSCEGDRDRVPRSLDTRSGNKVVYLTCRAPLATGPDNLSVVVGIYAPSQMMLAYSFGPEEHMKQWLAAVADHRWDESE